MSEENSVNPSAPIEVSRSSLIDSLSKGNPRIKQWLDSLAIATIETLTPENVDLASSVFFPASSPDAITRMAQATSTAPPQGATSLQGTSSLHLPEHPSLTPDVVSKLLSLTDQSRKMPSHFIKPPSSFGQSPMTSEDELRLSSLRKDTKSSATLEFTLRFLNTFCEARPHISEKSILDVLHTFLPLNTLEAVEYIRMKRDASLHLVYSYLQTHFGSVRSRAEVFQSLSMLTSSIGDLEPMQVLDRISKLLLQVSESEAECEMAALRDSLSYLRLLLGHDTFLTLKMYLQEGNFSTLYTICKCHYAEILLTRWREKRAEVRKVRQITHPLPADDDVRNPSPNNNPGNPGQLEHILRQILGKSNIPLSCFRCHSGSHLVSDCPQPPNNLRPKPTHDHHSRSQGSVSRAPSKPLTRQPYSSLPCSFHRAGRHLNSECFQQTRSECHVHPGTHSAATCTRLEFPPTTPSRPSGQPRSGQPQPLLPQYQNQFAGHPTYPHQPHPQQQRTFQPARAHHVPQPATLVQPPAPASTTQDPFDLDARTKEALIAALTALTTDE